MSAGIVPSAFLRRIADRVADPAIAQLAHQAADAFDSQHNAQNGAFQVALSRVELSLQEQLDALRVEVEKRLDTINDQQTQILNLLALLQLALRGDEAIS